MTGFPHFCCDPGLIKTVLSSGHLLGIFSLGAITESPPTVVNIPAVGSLLYIDSVEGVALQSQGFPLDGAGRLNLLVKHQGLKVSQTLLWDGRWCWAQRG